MLFYRSPSQEYRAIFMQQQQQQQAAIPLFELRETVRVFIDNRNCSFKKLKPFQRLGFGKAFYKNMDFAKKEMPFQKPEAERNNNSRIFLLTSLERALFKIDHLFIEQHNYIYIPCTMQQKSQEKLKFFLIQYTNIFSYKPLNV